MTKTTRRTARTVSRKSPRRRLTAISKSAARPLSTKRKLTVVSRAKPRKATARRLVSRVKRSVSHAIGR